MGGGPIRVLGNILPTFVTPKPLFSSRLNFPVLCFVASKTSDRFVKIGKSNYGKIGKSNY